MIETELSIIQLNLSLPSRASLEHGADAAREQAGERSALIHFSLPRASAPNNSRHQKKRRIS